MNGESEVRSAVLALVEAHSRLRASYRAMRLTLDAAASKEPRLALLWRGVAGVEQRELEIADQESAEIRSALSNNQQFADLLREYAGPV